MWLEKLAQDTRYSFRQFWKSPGLFLVAVLSLALGIGANTAIFTLINAIMLRTLPVANPGELYALGDAKLCCSTTYIQEDFSLYSYPLYKSIRDNTPEFSGVAAFQPGLVTLNVRRSGTATPAETSFGEFVSGNYFSMLGVGAFAGRVFSLDDDQPAAQPVAVMSYHAWHQRYGSDPGVIGSTFTLSSMPVTVIGITPPGFFGDTLRSDPPDFWVPLSLEPLFSRDNPLLNAAGQYWLYAIGRLKPGTAASRAEARVTTEVSQWIGREAGLSEQNRRRIAKLRVILTPAGSGIGRLRSSYDEALRLLIAVSSLVLLIACANIANLLLARGAANRLQSALRVALGASRARLLQQDLTEGVLLALLSGIAGIAVAFGATRAILLLAFRGASYVPIDATPPLPVLAFAFGLSLLTGILVSMIPAWIASNTDPAEPMRGGGRSTRDHAALPQKLLVILQAVLSLVLLAGAGLFTRSLQHLQNQQFGFQTQSRLIVKLNPAQAGYTVERLPALYRQMETRFRNTPAVISASLALQSPLDAWSWNSAIWITGRAPGANPANDNAYYDFVSSQYFETIGTRLLRGRLIEERDTPTSRRVTVINETFARKYLAHEDPIGRHMGMENASHSGDYEIIGIVEDAKYRDAKAPADPMFFIPLLQTVQYKDPADIAYQSWANFIGSIQLRVAGRPEDFQATIRRTLADIDPNLTAVKILTFDEHVGGAFNRPRLIARLTTFYGILALLLSSIGLYGLAAYLVARRTSEIGIRMALGAQRFSVVVMVLRGTMFLIVVGLVIGIPIVWAGGRAIESQLYGVKGHDPLVLGSAIAVLAGCALLAGIVPARRAASIDPMRALKTE